MKPKRKRKRKKRVAACWLFILLTTLTCASNGSCPLASDTTNSTKTHTRKHNRNQYTKGKKKTNDIHMTNVTCRPRMHWTIQWLWTPMLPRPPVKYPTAFDFMFHSLSVATLETMNVFCVRTEKKRRENPGEKPWAGRLSFFFLDAVARALPSFSALFFFLFYL